jgi:hypothetical protein
MMQFEAKTYLSGEEMVDSYRDRHRRLRMPETREAVIVPLPLPHNAPEPSLRLEKTIISSGYDGTKRFDAHVLEWRVQKYLAEHNCHRYIAARAAQMGFSAEEICIGGRKRKLAFSRQILMYEIRAKFHKSFPQIGRMFGGRDHTTCLYSYRKIEQLIAEGKF